MVRVYYRFGKKYIKLKRDEVIKKGAMQSWENGELQPIANSDGETIGNIPASFSDERDFYNPAYDELASDQKLKKQKAQELDTESNIKGKEIER